MKKLSLDALQGKKGNIVSNNLLTMISGGENEKKENPNTQNTYSNVLRRRPRGQVYE